eukprot:Ihof_evm7s110 gene=Ihof_evmTU7s110
MLGHNHFQLEELEGLMLPEDKGISNRWHQQENINWQLQQQQLQQQLLEDRQNMYRQRQSQILQQRSSLQLQGGQNGSNMMQHHFPTNSETSGMSISLPDNKTMSKSMSGETRFPSQNGLDSFYANQRNSRESGSQSGINAPVLGQQLDTLGMSSMHSAPPQQFSSNNSPFSDANATSFRRSSTGVSGEVSKGNDFNNIVQPMLDPPNPSSSNPSLCGINFQELHINTPFDSQVMFGSQLGQTQQHAVQPSSSQQILPQQPSHGLIPGGVGDTQNMLQPRGDVTFIRDLVIITNQPAPFGRFRYKSEQRERSLEADKGYPEVQINPKYFNIVPSGAAMTVRLVTKTVDERGESSPHFHELAGGTSVLLMGVERKAIFDNLTVLMSKQGSAEPGSARRNKEDQRAVRLRFEITFVHQDVTYYGCATSQPVFNAKLMVNKVSHAFGPVTGQNEIVLLCSKVRRGTTTMFLSDASLQLQGRLFTTQDVSAIKSDTAQWRMEPGTNPPLGVCVLPVRYLAFHHQYAIMVEMPPYHNVNVTEPTRIHLKIIDFEDGTESPPIPYIYLPSEDVRQARTQENKKRRMDEGMRQFWQQFQ